MKKERLREVGDGGDVDLSFAQLDWDSDRPGEYTGGEENGKEDEEEEDGKEGNEREDEKDEDDRLTADAKSDKEAGNEKKRDGQEGD